MGGHGFVRCHCSPVRRVDRAGRGRHGRRVVATAVPTGREPASPTEWVDRGRGCRRPCHSPRPAPRSGSGSGSGESNPSVATAGSNAPTAARSLGAAVRPGRSDQRSTSDRGVGRRAVELIRDRLRSEPAGQDEMAGAVAGKRITPSTAARGIGPYRWGNNRSPDGGTPGSNLTASPSTSGSRSSSSRSSRPA